MNTYGGRGYGRYSMGVLKGGVNSETEVRSGGEEPRWCAMGLIPAGTRIRLWRNAGGPTEPKQGTFHPPARRIRAYTHTCNHKAPLEHHHPLSR